MPWSLPARVDNRSDSPAFRKRARRIIERHSLAVVDAVNELGELGLVAEAHAEVRVMPVVPLFKLYVINESEVFFGYYPLREHTVTLEEIPTPIWDLMGKDATLFHHSADADPESMASQYVQQSMSWFESLWTTVTRKLPL